MRRLFGLISILLLAACTSSVSTTRNLEPMQGGLPYKMPKGLVPVIVFVDADGVGITIEPSVNAIDTQAGTFVARITPNPLVKENITLSTDAETGFLTAASSDSETQILEVAREAAAASQKLSLQNARAAFLSERVVVLEDAFDPLSRSDIQRINAGMRHALRHAAQAFPETVAGFNDHKVTLSVAMPDGTDPFFSAGRSVSSTLVLPDCTVGICARTLTSRLVRIELDGTAFGGKLVNIPSREIIPIELTSSTFANRNVSIQLSDGIYTGTTFRQDSEALGVVKVPGQIIGGIIEGFTETFEARQTLAQKEQAALEAEANLAQSQQTSLELNSASAAVAAAGADYQRRTLTIYPFSNALQRSVQAQIAETEARRAAEIERIQQQQTTNPLNDNNAPDLLDDGSQTPPPAGTQTQPPGGGQVSPPGGGGG
ncbi:MAG: hypothetical protein AAGA15_04135 [Pseudomonadota bacterium]